jgi:acetyl esterase/lipase
MWKSLLVVGAVVLSLGQAAAPANPSAPKTPEAARPVRGTIPLPEGAKLLKDIPYVTNGHERQKLDIATIKSDKPVPLIVWIHGGGWFQGNKSVARAAPFLKEGYAVAAINYRLSQHAVFPAQLEDCKAAIRFLRANAREYNIDPDRIGVWGESAGGHLAALVGTSGDVKGLSGEKPEHADVSEAVCCVVDYFGPTDLGQLPAMAGEKVKYDPKAGPGVLLTNFLGGSLDEKKELVKIANPLTYIKATSPAFLIVHGDADPIVPVGQSRILYEALKKAGVKADYLEIKKGGHGSGIYGNAEVWGKVKALFAEKLKGEPVVQKAAAPANTSSLPTP